MNFRFYEYSFPNKVDIFKEYLSNNNMNYRIIDNNIFFQFENQYCKKLIEASATFEEDRITRLQLKCYPISFNNRKKIEEELDSKYKLVEKDLNSMKRIYEAEDYTIVLNNPENLLIDVQFEPVLYVQQKEDKLQLKRTIIFTVLGVLLSTLFITLYFNYKSNLVLNIITAIVAISYAIFQFAYLYLRKSLLSKGTKIALCIIIPFVYVLLLIVLLIFALARTGILFESDFTLSLINSIDAIFVFVYLSPSFHILLLLAAGLSYA